jgi:type I restriction enzyme R subunit
VNRLTTTKADLKRKFSGADPVNQAETTVGHHCLDISTHYSDNWQGTGFKAQLVCPKKRIAIKYKELLDQIGLVSSEVLITSPDSRKVKKQLMGETSNEEKAFWKRMMDEQVRRKNTKTNLINRFKTAMNPEIIIVVDKLTDGFDDHAIPSMYIDVH